MHTPRITAYQPFEESHTMFRYQPYERFHVSLGTRHTTISIDRTLYLLMSLQLGAQPNTRAAHRAVRTWLQQHLDRNGDPRQHRISHWLRGKIAEALIGPALKQKYDEWFDSEIDKHDPRETSPLTQRDRSL